MADRLGKRPSRWSPSSVTIAPKKELEMAGESTPKGGWHSGRFAHTFAAIDLGTNNCRLLVARASIDGFEVIDAYSRPVRLGEGVAQWERMQETHNRRGGAVQLHAKVH